MIYLDNGATTRVDVAVLAAMNRYHSLTYGNAASVHRPGVTAARAVQESRQSFADMLGVEPEEIVFTSGGTEADNLAVRGAALGSRRARLEGRNIVCSAVEHPAVMEACRSLERDGFEVRLAPVDGQAVVQVDGLLRLVDERTALVSVMHANNVVGSLQPVAQIGGLLQQRHPDIVFHVDAVQSFLKADLSPASAGVDLLSVSSHKIHGPKGAGFLWVRKGLRLRPLFFGGGQQRDIRPGTENVPGIVGFAEAARLGWASRRDDRDKMTCLRDRLIALVLDQIPDTELNGHPTDRLCNNVNISFHGCPAETLLHHLEARGVIASAGSACHSGNRRVSQVFHAMGHQEDPGTIRFTLSRHTTDDEIDATLAALREVVPEVRSLT